MHSVLYVTSSFNSTLSESPCYKFMPPTKCICCLFWL